MPIPTRIDHMGIGDVIVGRSHSYRIADILDRGTEIHMLLDVIGSYKQLKVHLPAGFKLPVKAAAGS